MKKQLYYLAFILVLLSSCKNSTKNQNQEVEATPLVGEVLQEDSLVEAGIFVSLRDDTLILKSSNPAALLRAYTIKGDSLISSVGFLRRGNGPKEVDIFRCWMDKCTKKLTLLNINGTLTHGLEIDLNSSKNCTSSDLWNRLDFNKIEKVRYGDGFVRLPNGRILITGGGYDTPVTLSEIDVKNQSVVPIGFWPEDRFDGRNLVKQSIYIDNATLHRNMKSEQLLYVSGKGKYAFIFRLEKNTVTQKIMLFDAFPSYMTAEDGINSRLNADCEAGFRVTVTDSLIYMRPEEYEVVRGQMPDNYKGYPYYYNDKVYVFDWNGKMVRKYMLDTPFFDFIIDEGNKRMYASTDDLETGGTIVKRYSLR